MNTKSSKDCARLLKSVADDTRLGIIECLFQREQSVSEIAQTMRKRHSTISHHLGILRNLGIVVDKKKGKFILYGIHPALLRKLEKTKYKNVLDFECCSIGFQGDTKVG